MIKDYIQKIRQFVQHDLWVTKIGSLSKGRASLFRFVRILIITFSEFAKDKCAQKAASLTYFTMLSLAPVLAMAFGIAQSFGLKQYLEDEINSYFSGQEDVINKLTEFSDNMLSSQGSGIITGTSIVFIIYAVVRLLTFIEGAFNDIWDTLRGRSWKRKLTDYMAIILLGPVLLIVSSSATAYLVTNIEDLTKSIEILGFFKDVILFLINLVPYTLIWFLLFLLYIIFPNTSVKIKPALIAGIIAGTIFQLTQFGWIHGQVYLSRYNDVYGTLAALPLFMIWLQLSWTIILFGAELAFALQNVRNWSYDSKDLEINQKSKRRFTLMIMKIILVQFEKNDEPISFDKICDQMTIPMRFVREIVNDLMEAKLILRVAAEEEELYVPGLDSSKLDIYTVYKYLETKGLDNLPQEAENKGYKEVSSVVDDMDKSLKNSKANKLVKDL